MYSKPRREKYKTTVNDLNRINSYNKGEVIEDYKFNKTLLEKRIKNKESVKVYIAALGSFPYLFLLGALAKNAYSNVKFIDFNRYKDGGKWYTLPLFKTTNDKITHKLLYNQDNTTINDEINRLNKNDADIGIALGYTFPIKKEVVPSTLKNSTLYLTASEEPRHDILSSEESQESLLKDISYYLNSLSKPNRNIHLFVSAQASMCMNIGKHYMDNAHGAILLYNYYWTYR
ncbi:MAG TPA: SAVED domain-containing protein [Sulfurospirillum arcachonense]|nr:SAVED domain-containing protein [Sulfurospirillum arcachonense]